MSREVCGNQHYLLGCRQFWSPYSLPGLDQGDARESDSLPGRCQGKRSPALECLGLCWGNPGPLGTGEKALDPDKLGQGRLPEEGVA